MQIWLFALIIKKEKNVMDKVGYLMDALDEERYIDRRLVIRVDQFTDELLFATSKSLLQIKLWTES